MRADPDLVYAPLLLERSGGRVLEARPRFGEPASPDVQKPLMEAPE